MYVLFSVASIVMNLLNMFIDSMLNDTNFDGTGKTIAGEFQYDFFLEFCGFAGFLFVVGVGFFPFFFCNYVVCLITQTCRCLSLKI